VNRRGGYKPDPDVVRQRRPKFPLLKAARGLGVAPLPPSTNNRQFLSVGKGGPGILDQGSTGSCEGHAHASGFTLGAALGGDPVLLRSPIALYTMARILGASPPAGSELPPLEDNGTEPSLVLQAAQLWGAPSAVDWANYPADPATINQPPNLGELESAADFKLYGAYFLTSQGEQFCRDLMTALAAKFVCTAAIAASSPAFNSYTGGILSALDADVDHATLWVDYEWDGANLASLVVYGVNSWGVGWGEDDAGVGGGMYRCNASFLQEYAQDCAVLDVAAIARSA
jgi:hypothetical protein